MRFGGTNSGRCTPLSMSSKARRRDMATVIQFPGTSAPHVGARLPIPHVRADKSAARGSLAWASAVIDAKLKLCEQIADARRCAKARRLVEFPKPKFVSAVK